MMFVNGKEFFVKGMAYSPAPLGQQGMTSAGYGNTTGLCSVKVTPYNEWKSACYDSDYFDGSSDVWTPTRFPTGFAPVWQRDLPKMKQLGVNTIRLYNANPTTKNATLTYPKLFPVPGAGKDHTQFMSYAASLGLYVIFPLLSDNNMFYNTPPAVYKRLLRWQIDEVCNSPALLAWQLGNEMDWSWNSLWNNATIIAKINAYMNYARRYTLSRCNRVIPVISAFQYTQSKFTTWISQLHIDAFAGNIFGTSFGNLFSGDGGSWAGISKLSCQYNKPLLITEYGPTYMTGQTYTTGALNQIWSNIVANQPNGLLGGCYFEMTDEKALGKDFGLYKATVTQVAGATSTTADVFVADTITAKQQWNDLLSGTYNSKPYNIPTNVFTTLLRRSAVTYPPTTDRCSSTTYKTCPSATSTTCSGNGICNRSTGACTCAVGWTGTNCNTAKCPSTTSSVCSGRGTCSSIVTPPECICNAGYFGLSCEKSVTTVAAGTCPNDCSTNGDCNTTTQACTCWVGWTGTDCSAHVL